MDTDELAILVHAAAAGSISAAGRRLGISPVVASRRLSALEAKLGVRLMHRTTRSVALTPEGEALLPHAREMLDAEAAALAMLAPGRCGVSGLLRVTAPAAFGRKVVAPMLPRLLADNPQLRIDLEVTDRLIDIVGEGFDLAIRIGNLRDSGLVARRIAPNERVLCASPAYLSQKGSPQTLADLIAHECLLLNGTNHWRFHAEGKVQEVRVTGRFTSSSIEALHAMCVGGHGLTILSHWDALEDLISGKLVRVDFDAALPQELSVWAVYPTRRLVSGKVKAFISALATAIVVSDAAVSPS